MFDYPEIESLNKIIARYKVVITTDWSQVIAAKEYYPKVVFKIRDKIFELYVDDEYEDLKENNPMLDLCLVLRELESYNLAEDYLIWCAVKILPPEDSRVLQLYRDLGTTYRDVSTIIGTIDSKVSDWDFEMNAGAAQSLRNSK